jgi:hypothetical protein
MPGPEVEHSIDGWRLPAHDVAIAFGDAEAGKSLMSLYAAGRLAAEGIPTLYCEFAWNANPHRGRLAQLFPEALPPLHYCKCDRLLVYESDRLRAYILICPPSLWLPLVCQIVWAGGPERSKRPLHSHAISAR